MPESKYWVVDFLAVGNLDEAFAVDQRPTRRRVGSAIPLPQNISECVRHCVRGDSTQTLTIVQLQASMGSATEGMRLLQYRVEQNRRRTDLNGALIPRCANKLSFYRRIGASGL